MRHPYPYLSQCPLQPAQRLRLALAGQGAFPEAEDGPAGLAELAGDEAVALAIAGDLVVPEFPVLPGAGGVAGAAVPEAAVHKHDDALGAKHEVRPHAGSAPLLLCGPGMGHGDGHLPPPAGDLLGTQHGSKPQLRGRIARGADAAHHLAAFGWGEDVGHEEARLGLAKAGPMGRGIVN